jgi:hypothetical protein
MKRVEAYKKVRAIDGRELTNYIVGRHQGSQSVHAVGVSADLFASRKPECRGELGV